MWFGDLPPVTANGSRLPDEFVNWEPRRDRLAPVTQRFLRAAVATGTPPAITASPSRQAASWGTGASWQPQPLAGVESFLVMLS